MLMVLCGTKTLRRFLPQDGHSLSKAQPLRQDTERSLACAVCGPCFPSLSESCSESQTVVIPPIPFFKGDCVLGRLAEDTKEKQIWEDSSWPDHGGWDGWNTIIHKTNKQRQKCTSGRSEDLEGVVDHDILIFLCPRNSNLFLGRLFVPSALLGYTCMKWISSCPKLQLASTTLRPLVSKGEQIHPRIHQWH